MGICGQNCFFDTEKNRKVKDNNAYKNNFQNKNNTQKKNNNDMTHKNQNNYKYSSNEDISEGKDNYDYNKISFKMKIKYKILQNLTLIIQTLIWLLLLFLKITQMKL